MLRLTQRLSRTPTGSLRAHRAAPVARFSDDRQSPVSVFMLQGAPPELDLDLLDVQDAVETCQCASLPNERAQCYACFGLDAEKVEKYYGPVMQWEDAIDQGDRTGKKMVAMGSLMLTFIVVSKLRGAF